MQGANCKNFPYWSPYLAQQLSTADSDYEEQLKTFPFSSFAQRNLILFQREADIVKPILQKTLSSLTVSSYVSLAYWLQACMLYILCILDSKWEVHSLLCKWQQISKTRSCLKNSSIWSKHIMSVCCKNCWSKNQTQQKTPTQTN